MPDTEGNGHKPQVPEKLKDFLEAGDFDHIFTSHQTAGAIEKFVERGDKVEDLLLRAQFRDIDHGNAVVRQYRKACHFHDTEEQELLINHAAMCPAIGGHRIDLLKQAVIGKSDQESKRGWAHGMRQALGLGDKKDDGNG